MDKRRSTVIHSVGQQRDAACGGAEGGLRAVASLWEECLDKLEGELSPQQFNTWIRPLQAVENGQSLLLLAPNRFVQSEVKQKLARRIMEVLRRINRSQIASIEVEIGREAALTKRPAISDSPRNGTLKASLDSMAQRPTGLQPEFTFEAFVEGRSNQFALAYAIQVSEDLSGASNPFLIYGGVGLGKTHLMQALGNATNWNRPNTRIVYVHSERFFSDMVSAIRRNAIDDFKRYYRSIDVLLIDDVQFFVGKERTQEEFFHIFNKLHEDQRQIVVTCDRYPKAISGLEERLTSRLSWGLSVEIEPPDIETRAAILMRKAQEAGFELSREVTLFIAERIRSNVRELEGALRRVVANAQFTHRPITLDLTREALRDILALQSKLITIENIQQTVARYYKIRVADLISKRRSRSITRPRQIAMALAKDLTNHSLPEIGDAFGGRDHTTVLHARKRVRELRDESAVTNEEYESLCRVLTA